MSDEEVDELLKIADTSNGEVNYTGTLVYQSNVAPFPSWRKADEDLQSLCGRSWRIEQRTLAILERTTYM